MKILKLPSYFFPERISSSHLSEDTREAYLKAGFTIENYVPMPTRGVSREVWEKYKKISYEELEDGKVIVHRFPMFREGKNPVLRAIRYVLVNLIQYHKGIRTEDVDLVMAGSTPPTQGLLCGKVAAKLSKKQGKKVPFIYTLQDVFPDSLLSTGMVKKKGVIWKIGRKMEDKTYSYADKIIVISEDIKRNIMDKGVPEEKIEVIYNWIDTETVRPVAFCDNILAKELGITGDKFRVVYAGNLGMAQSVSTLIGAAERLQNDNVEFLIFGKGAEEEKLKKSAERLSNVRFFPLQPAERISEVYSLGDCCAVLCKAGIGGIGVPSKTWSIMACGRPLLVSFDKSELCHTVSKANAGLCSPAEDVEALIENIRALNSDRAKTLQMGENARKYAEEYADKKQATQKHIELIKKITRQY